MKKSVVCMVLCLCIIEFACAENFIWTGPLNGKWSNPRNWSVNGQVASSVPGPQDAILFARYITGGMSTYAIELDVSPTIASLRVDYTARVKLFTAVNTTFTVTTLLSLQGDLTDSTTEDVQFNFVLDRATGSLANPSPEAHWYFSGRVPVSRGRGAFFTAQSGAPVTVGNGIYIVCRSNSGTPIIKDSSRLAFEAGSHYVLENKLAAEIPPASWAAPQGINGAPSPLAAQLVISGTVQTITHSGIPSYGRVLIDLPELASDVDLALPGGTVIKSQLAVSNTNSHTLTLLSAPPAADSITVRLTGDDAAGFIMQGDSTRVALARASGQKPAAYFHFIIPSFSQSGGNFSLQDAGIYRGSTVLTTSGSILQTGGTFITSSTTVNAGAKMVVEMNGPVYMSRPYGLIFNDQVISMSSGSIDNGRGMVTLRAAQTSFPYTNPGSAVLMPSPVGITLNSPLQVGKLELDGGPVFSSTVNMLTVTNPAADAVKISNRNSYVNGPVRRSTNSVQPYLFPTGKGSKVLFNLDTCALIPSVAASSVFQAEYFNTGYTDTAVSAGLKGIDTSQYWSIARVSGADAQVRLTLSKAVPRAAATDNLVIARHNGSQWINEQGSFLSPGTSTAGSVTSRVLSAFTIFTVGFSVAANAPLPVRLTSFSANRERAGIRLRWKVAEDASRFNVLRGKDGTSFNVIATVPGSALQRDYYWLDSLPGTGNTYYRLGSYGKDGVLSLSSIVVVGSQEPVSGAITLVPTLVRSHAILNTHLPVNGLLHLMVTDISGRIRKNMLIPVQAGSAATTIDLSDLPAGTYQLNSYQEGSKPSVLRFVKL